MNAARAKRRPIHIRPRTPPGAAPGTIVVDPAAAHPKISIMAFGRDELEEVEVAEPDQAAGFLDKYPVTWIHVDGLGNADIIGRFGETFGLHPLALEDVIDINQRTKVEQYDSHLYIVIRMPILNEDFTTQQLNVFLGKNFIITFQEYRLGYLDPVRERVRKATPRTRLLRTDYLAYAIIDAAIDSYFPVLNHYGDHLEDIENDITSQPEQDTLARVHKAKRDLHNLRRAVWPQRDAMNVLLREQTPFITDETRVYLRDCHDHAIQLIELTETFREFGSDLVNLYMTRISNDMNAVMKVLTIIATIFIPLGFIAGLYGMNFNPAISPWNMPELNWPCGYPFALGVMAVTALGMLAYFRRRQWF